MKKYSILAIICVLLATFAFIACTKKNEVAPTQPDKKMSLASTGRTFQDTTNGMELDFFGFTQLDKRNATTADFSNANGLYQSITYLGEVSGVKSWAIYGGQLTDASIVQYREDKTADFFEYKQYVYHTNIQPRLSDTPIDSAIIISTTQNQLLTDRASISRASFDYYAIKIFNECGDGSTVSEPNLFKIKFVYSCGFFQSTFDCTKDAIAAVNLLCPKGVNWGNIISNGTVFDSEYSCK